MVGPGWSRWCWSTATHYYDPRSFLVVDVVESSTPEPLVKIVSVRPVADARRCRASSAALWISASERDGGAGGGIGAGVNCFRKDRP